MISLPLPTLPTGSVRPCTLTLNQSNACALKQPASTLPALPRWKTICRLRASEASLVSPASNRGSSNRGMAERGSWRLAGCRTILSRLSLQLPPDSTDGISAFHRLNQALTIRSPEKCSSQSPTFEAEGIVNGPERGCCMHPARVAATACSIACRNVYFQFCGMVETRCNTIGRFFHHDTTTVHSLLHHYLEAAKSRGSGGSLLNCYGQDGLASGICRRAV